MTLFFFPSNFERRICRPFLFSAFSENFALFLSLHSATNFLLQPGEIRPLPQTQKEQLLLLRILPVREINVSSRSSVSASPPFFFLPEKEEIRFPLSLDGPLPSSPFRKRRGDSFHLFLHLPFKIGFLQMKKSENSLFPRRCLVTAIKWRALFLSPFLFFYLFREGGGGRGLLSLTAPPNRKISFLHFFAV